MKLFKRKEKKRWSLRQKPKKPTILDRKNIDLCYRIVESVTRLGIVEFSIEVAEEVVGDNKIFRPCDPHGHTWSFFSGNDDPEIYASLDEAKQAMGNFKQYRINEAIPDKYHYVD